MQYNLYCIRHLPSHSISRNHTYKTKWLDSWKTTSERPKNPKTDFSPTSFAWESSYIADKLSDIRKLFMLHRFLVWKVAKKLLEQLPNHRTKYPIKFTLRTQDGPWTPRTDFFQVFVLYSRPESGPVTELAAGISSMQHRLCQTGQKLWTVRVRRCPDKINYKKIKVFSFPRCQVANPKWWVIESPLSQSDHRTNYFIVLISFSEKKPSNEKINFYYIYLKTQRKRELWKNYRSHL